MKVHYGLDFIKGIHKPVITTGSFDGVHLGHMAIINRLAESAKSLGGESVLITFHPHPRKVLFPESAHSLLLISSQEEKIEQLSRTSLDHLVIVEFTKEFSQITSIDFIRNILVGKFGARKIIIGFNHHFGHNREGNYDFLYELGQYYKFEVEEIPEQDIHQETVSSTLIRKALTEGKIQRANAYLDHSYCIIGRLAQGTFNCKEINCNTYSIAITEESKLVPPDGVYAVSVQVAFKALKGIVNIKRQPGQDIYDSRLIAVEVHLCGIDTNDNTRYTALINEKAVINFAKRLREEKQFQGAEDLKLQIEKDINEVEELIY